MLTIRTSIVTAVAGLAVAIPGLAVADPGSGRELVLYGLGGASGAATPQAEVSTVPFVPMIGAELTWDRPLPELAPTDLVTARASVAPQAALSMHGRRAMGLAGARLELSIVNRTRGAVSLWLAPGFGAIDGASSSVVGGELGLAYRVRANWRLGFVYGVYTWQEPHGESQTLARTTMPVSPSAPDDRVLQGQLALVLGRPL